MIADDTILLFNFNLESSSATVPSARFPTYDEDYDHPIKRFHFRPLLSFHSTLYLRVSFYFYPLEYRFSTHQRIIIIRYPVYPSLNAGGSADNKSQAAGVGGLLFGIHICTTIFPANDKNGNNTKHVEQNRAEKKRRDEVERNAPTRDSQSAALM